MSDILDRRTLFVRSIPAEVTSEELSEFFSQFAPLKHAVVVTDKDQKSREFGFVSFALDEDAKLALEKAGKIDFHGTKLRVDIAKRRDRKKDSESGPKADKPHLKGSRLIIRNLPWSVRKPADLQKQFQRYGTVVECTIPKKKDGKLCGFGFVKMKKFSAAETAVEKSKGLKIDGREVSVDFVMNKTDWESSGKGAKVKIEKDEDEKSDHKEEDVDDEDIKSDDKEEEEEDDHDDEEKDQDEDQEEKEEEEEEEKRPRPNNQWPYTIFIRNLPYDATEESLKEHFEQFGPIKYALPVIDKATGMARGTGFVAFKNEEAYTACLDNAPDTSGSSSLLLSDDAPAAYVFEGRMLSITSAVDRSKAGYLKDKNTERRNQLLGKEVGKQDKRNLFLLNEGRIDPSSSLAQVLSKTELEIREKSYKLRIDQLNANPSLHLSLTRLAIRNLPRVLTEKSLKALGRKAVVEFATEVKNGDRQPLSKEEVGRSTKHKQHNSLENPDSKKSKKKGLVRQAKILVEVNSSGEAGRSKGYGFLEFRDHKSALMALRYLNCHEVTYEDIIAGLTEEEKNLVKHDGQKRRLIVEFAIEHAKVVNKRREKVKNARDLAEMKKEKQQKEHQEKQRTEEESRKRAREENKTREIIGSKRRKKKGKK